MIFSALFFWWRFLWLMSINSINILSVRVSVGLATTDINVKILCIIVERFRDFFVPSGFIFFLRFLFYLLFCINFFKNCMDFVILVNICIRTCLKIYWHLCVYVNKFLTGKHTEVYLHSSIISFVTFNPWWTNTERV